MWRESVNQVFGKITLGKSIKDQQQLGFSSLIVI